MPFRISAIVCAYNEERTAAGLRCIRCSRRRARRTRSSSSTTRAPMRPAPWRVRIPGVRGGRRAAQGTGESRARRHGRPRSGDVLPTSTPIAARRCSWLERIERRFDRSRRRRSR